MTLTEKTAYIKGLCEGLEFDKKDSAEAKIIKALIDLCDDMAKEIDDIECDIADLADYCEELDEDLGDVEQVLIDEYDDECDCGCTCEAEAPVEEAPVEEAVVEEAAVAEQADFEG